MEQYTKAWHLPDTEENRAKFVLSQDKNSFADCQK